ncbi:uncharacterized protein LOC9644202 isoform X1 [Selaginella moellendorffii]|uniref:uncharacterized protein LOC9644202 isoform X1 n=1 Tax=Selaginella moellendorffii TaxID=88036 RepID=UPI000D1C95CA|nr:uncharacterized protein LOC9644202 isoform X1 [Selaginella moellendorffii]|eukprot:XP_024544608.1 uncharacterized protein LOC9644202 isoform X1 [Selaginella moellendorffii]
MILLVAGGGRMIMTRFLVLLLLLLMLLLGLLLLHPFSSSSPPPPSSLAVEDNGRWIKSLRSFLAKSKPWYDLGSSGNSEKGRSGRKLLYRTQFGVCHRDTVAQSCQPFYNVTCKQGGFRLECWSCEMIQRCTPQAVGCYFHFMDNITYCGF